MHKDGADLVSDGMWFGAGEGSAFGVLAHRDGVVDRSGVLVLPPVGYAWWSSFQTRRELTDELVRRGHTTLRLHYHGTGDAPGTQWAEGQMTAWHDSVTAAATALRELGCTRLTLVGIEIGATFALELAERLGAARVVAWEPVVSGRREARALGTRSLRVPDDDHVAQAGTVLGADALAELSGVDLAATASFSGPALVVADGGADPLVRRLRDTGARVEHIGVADGESALVDAAEDAVVARDLVSRIVEWIGPGERGFGSIPPIRGEAELAWGDGRVREEFVTVGSARLRGVRCAPVAATATGTVVILNSGSEPHVGPGRAWVELARFLGLAGLRSLRVDFRGWGESPDDGHAPGRPYDAHGIEDILDVVEALESAGEGPVVLVGLCAGAWLAMRAVLRRPVAGVVALNPQLYWRMGDPVEALLSDTRRRRASERKALADGRRSGQWDELDRAGERNFAGEWLDALADGPTAISMIFAEADDGLEYLHDRLERRLRDVTSRGHIDVREIPGIDHAMQRVWERPAMFAAIRDAATGAFVATGLVETVARA